MKRLQGIFVLFMVSFVLIGCDPGTVTLTLKGDNESLDIIDEYKLQEDVGLPILEKEGFVFVGWSDENDTIYYDMITIEEDTELIPVFEAYEDVFEMQFVEQEHGDNTVSIGGYSGVAEYLKIPQIIDGYVVVSVGGVAFQNSTMRVIEVPMDVTFAGYGFIGNVSLEEVYFYGDYIYEGVTMVSRSQYDDLKEEYGDLCEIESGSIHTLPIVFSESCPIKEVVAYEYITIDDMMYETFSILWLSNKMEKAPFQPFMPGAFMDATNLHTVEIPEDYEAISMAAFEGCSNLRHFVIGDNENFVFEDGVLYNADRTMLYYHTAQDEYSEFTIPSSVTNISFYGFNPNSKITKITVPNTFEGHLQPLLDILDLEEISVEEGHSIYRDIDGVLYDNDTLVIYPPKREGDSFIVPDDVIAIGNGAFYHNQYLTEIDFNNVRFIHQVVFVESVSLTELYFSSTVEYLGSNTFRFSTIETVIWDSPLMESSWIDFGTTEGNRITLYVPDEYYEDYINFERYEAHIEFIKPMSELDE